MSIRCVTIYTDNFSLAVLSAYNICSLWPSVSFSGHFSWWLTVLKGTSKYYLWSRHEHVIVHCALNVQLELSSHLAQMICVLVTKHPDTFIYGVLLFVCFFVFISKAIFHAGTKSCLYFLLSDSHICLSIHSTASITVWEHFTDGWM